jgi:hypothetical protein
MDFKDFLAIAANKHAIRVNGVHVVNMNVNVNMVAVVIQHLVHANVQLDIKVDYVYKNAKLDYMVSIVKQNVHVKMVQHVNQKRVHVFVRPDLRYVARNLSDQEIFNF